MNRILSIIGLLAIVITVAQLTIGILVMSMFTGSIERSLELIWRMQ